MPIRITPEELQDKLRRIHAEAGPKIHRGMELAALNVEGKAKKNCTPGETPYYKAPFDTGKLRASITSLVEDRGDSYMGVVGCQGSYDGGEVPYAIYIHEGTYKMSARPFILDAITEEQDHTLQIIADAVRDHLQEYCT